MNTQEIIETLRPMANASWWKSLVIAMNEAKSLREESHRFKQAAWIVKKATQKPTTKAKKATKRATQKPTDERHVFDDMAVEVDRQAAAYSKAAADQWALYWSAFAAVREVAPQLLGELPVADGVAVDDIDPKAEAKTITGLIGKLLATESDPWERVRTRDCIQDKSTLSKHASDPAKAWIKHGPRGWYDIRKSRLPDYLEG
jgi:hypothetical protein